MRNAILVLLLAAGCAHEAPPYTGVTYAQARWGAHITFCRDYVARPGAKDPAIVEQCRASEIQAAAEDAAERDQLQSARQEREDAAAADRQQAAINTMSAGLHQYATTPLPPPMSPTVNCTSTTSGDTVWTNCR
jgi:spore germination cell wall hydrolase CwlJ-like protein